MGYYLISEGLICKNGTVRNSYKLGFSYLLKAQLIEESFVNLCAIAQSIDFNLRTSTKNVSDELYQNYLNFLEKATKYKYSYEVQYNKLRILYLCDFYNDGFYGEIKDLVEKYTCKETVSLLLGFLSSNLLKDEALSYVETFGFYIDDFDLLMAYAKMEMYENSYNLCESVFESYSLDEFMVSAIIESCINTGHSNDAERYISIVKKKGADDVQFGWIKDVCENTQLSKLCRENLIKTYKHIPPSIPFCCYYGCKKHGNGWE